MTPFESQQAIADSMKREDEPVLAASLERLSKAGAEQINGGHAILARAREDLTHGLFPDTGTQRFYSITIFRVKSGHEGDFETAAKAFGTAVDRAGVQRDFRVYQVVAGMTSPTFLVFTSFTTYGAFDQHMADGLINAETIRFRLDPVMSHVPQSVRAQGPAFWMPKSAAVAAKPDAKRASKQEAKR